MLSKITVITVCYNAEAVIEDTILSVLRQTYSRIEYIIVDGASKDQTMRIVKDYEKEMQKKGIEYKYLSENDEGIYDAMNKGAHLATGDWIIFINAGDGFFNDQVIEKVFSRVILDRYDVVYGDGCAIDLPGKPIQRARNVDYLKYKKPFSHQAVFVKTNIQCDINFDLKYKICADFALFKEIYKRNGKFKQVDFVISYYSTDGVSMRLENVRDIFKEDMYICWRYGINIWSDFGYLIFILKRIKRLVLLKIFGSSPKNRRVADKK